MIATAEDVIQIPGRMVLVPEDQYEKMRDALRREEKRNELDRRIERLNRGEGIHKTMEELKAMEDE